MFVASSPPKTLSKAEQSRLLRTVAKAGNPRDLALLSLALGASLHLRELGGQRGPRAAISGWDRSGFPSLAYDQST
jgi:hypothetical protein